MRWWTFELLNDERRIGVPVEKRVQYTELVDTDRLYEALRRQGYKGREEFRRCFAQSHETCCTRPEYCFMMSFDGLHKLSCDVCCVETKYKMILPGSTAYSPTPLRAAWAT